MLDSQEIRKHFPFLQRVIQARVDNPNPKGRLFVDNTASTQLPLEILTGMAQDLFDYANVHRGEYDASQATTERFERAYNIAANLVNAESWREIILGRNTTEMINLVMRSMEYEFRDGDNIVISRLEHNSNYVPWYGLQKLLERIGKKVEVRIAGFDHQTGELDIDHLAKLVDHKTKLVSVTGASNFMGTKPNLRRIKEIASSSGYSQPNGLPRSYFLVDGAQLVPGSPVDVQEIGCDFLAWSFHKMALPLGVGGLYARKEVLETLTPFLYGGDMIEDVEEGSVKYKDLPWRYTAGTPNILGTIATGRGIEFLVNLGLGNLSVQEDIERVGRMITTEILLNTPRGDFEVGYTVDEQKQDLFGEYLSQHPDVEGLLRSPEQRLARARSVVKEAMGNILHYEQELTQPALDRLRGNPKIRVYGPLDASKRTPLVAFNVEGWDAKMVAFELNKRGVEVRNGTHCASLAHKEMGLTGTARMSFYVYNNADEVSAAVSALEEVARK
jgi:cysteine desulfurase/selenocysteine lyase